MADDIALRLMARSGWDPRNAAVFLDDFGGSGEPGADGADGEDGADALNGLVIVEHGAVAGTARPAVTAVYWIGSVEPTNMTDADLWNSPA